jgi:hypothetical protein
MHRLCELHPGICLAAEEKGRENLRVVVYCDPNKNLKIKVINGAGEGVGPIM